MGNILCFIKKERLSGNKSSQALIERLSFIVLVVLNYKENFNSIGNLKSSWLEGKQNIGVTSGASAPEHLVKELIDSLEQDYGYSLQGSREITDEGIAFRLPKGLR